MRIVFPSYDFRFPRLLVSLLGICFVSSCVIVLDSLSLFGQLLTMFFKFSKIVTVYMNIYKENNTKLN